MGQVFSGEGRLQLRNCRAGHGTALSSECTDQLKGSDGIESHSTVRSNPRSRALVRQLLRSLREVEVQVEIASSAGAGVVRWEGVRKNLKSCGCRSNR